MPVCAETRFSAMPDETSPFTVTEGNKEVLSASLQAARIRAEAAINNAEKQSILNRADSKVKCNTCQPSKVSGWKSLREVISNSSRRIV